MTRWIKAAVAMLALGGLSAAAADTSAQAKDREHQAEIQARMKARSAKDGKLTKMTKKQRADQAADAARAGGARVARTYHGAIHSARKGVHHLSKKTEKATK
jgi:hypothetical protein